MTPRRRIARLRGTSMARKKRRGNLTRKQERCVRSVKSEGKSKKSAIRICKAATNKKKNK